jgi:hypothetical protein
LQKKQVPQRLEAGLGFGCYATSNDAKLMQETLVPQRSAPPPADGRAAVSPCLPKGLLKSIADMPPWRWERLTGPNGEWREDDDWHLLNREGRMVARVRQEGTGYWVARPRIIPEPPIEGFEAACRRAVQVVMLTLAWPESERHSTHPGMSASQFDATRRDLSRKHPDWSAQEIDQHIVGILKPSTREEGCLIKHHHPPVNIVGGYKFPGAPVIDLSPTAPALAPTHPERSMCADSAHIEKRAAAFTGDSLDIPAFLLRRPHQDQERKAA